LKGLLPRIKQKLASAEIFMVKQLGERALKGAAKDIGIPRRTALVIIYEAEALE